MLPTSDPPVQQVILDSIADGVFTVDDQWRITSFNRAAERITGWPREEALGQPCRNVFQTGMCDDGCLLKQTCGDGRQLVDQPISITNRAGQRIPVSISTAVLRDQAGRTIGGVETFRDLSVVEQLRKQLEARYTFADIIGRSDAMQRLFEILPQFAASSSTVLIEGPSGTGKELVARAIHHLSPRREGRFIAVNCGALPDTLLESELFGYKAGAFTDARQDKPGRFALADGGTIFLDEIGDVSPAMQIKLLRVLQERVFEPLGSVDSARVDVRVITATNQDLAGLVRQGTFRQDLFYRVNIVRLQLPRLCERREDIPLLVDHFVDRFSRLQGKHVAGVSDTVLSALLAHDYPGNIRELENIIEYAFVLCRRGLIELEHLPPEIRGAGHLLSSRRHTALTLRDMEVLHIAQALRRHAGNRTAAAHELGINPSTLFRKIKALAIAVPRSGRDGRPPGSVGEVGS